MADIDNVAGFEEWALKSIARAARTRSTLAGVSFGQTGDFSVARAEVALMKPMFACVEDASLDCHWKLDCKNHNPPVLYIGPTMLA